MYVQYIPSAGQVYKLCMYCTYLGVYTHGPTEFSLAGRAALHLLLIFTATTDPCAAAVEREDSDPRQVPLWWWPSEQALPCAALPGFLGVLTTGRLVRTGKTRCTHTHQATYLRTGLAEASGAGTWEIGCGATLSGLSSAYPLFPSFL